MSSEFTGSAGQAEAAAASAVARAAGATGLVVLDRDWISESGSHYLDMVGELGSDLLVVASVRAVAQREAGACIAPATESWLQRAREAGQAWAGQHGARHREMRVVLVTVDPAGVTEVVTWIPACAEAV